MTFAHPIFLLFYILLGLVSSVLYLLNERTKKKLKRIWGDHFPCGIHCTPRIVKCFQNLFVILGLSFLGIALARPQWGFTLAKREFTGTNIVFVLDTSKSMLANDVRPNRLSLAKMSISSLLNSLSGDQVGLVAFAGSAFLQCPSTLDYGAFKLALQAIDTSIIPKGGTNLSAAMELAAQTFEKEARYKQMILLTDGEDLTGDAIKTAQKLAQNNIVVHTIGIGSTHGSPISITNERGLNEYMKDPEGHTIFTKLDEKTLQQISQITHGFYAPLGNAGDGLQKIYSTTLENLPKENFESIEKTPIEHYAWFAFAAFLFLVLEPIFCAIKRKDHHA